VVLRKWVSAGGSSVCAVVLAVAVQTGIAVAAEPTEVTTGRAPPSAQLAIGWQMAGSWTDLPGLEAWANCESRGEEGLANNEWTQYRCEHVLGRPASVRLMVYVP
jgi:hypothetical protein